METCGAKAPPGTLVPPGLLPLAGIVKDRFRLPKREKLKKRGEIQAVFKARQGVSCRGARLMLMKNGLGHNRIAFTFTRKFGSAVERNRSRRISREVYRHLRHFIKPGWDLVLLVYPEESFLSEGKAGLSLRTAQMRELFRRARLIENPAETSVQDKV